MRRIAVVALAIVLVGTAVVGSGIGLAVAQGEDGPVQTFLARVAEKLGIGEDELRSAMTEAQEDIIDEQVAEGRLTAEQGERLKERIEEKGLLGPFDRFAIRGHVRGQVRGLTVEAAAAVLDMEAEDLLDEVRDGKTLAEVAEAQGMSADKFTQALLSEVKTQLDALVADGKLTEEQANAILERTEENIDAIVNAEPGPGGPRRGLGGFGGSWSGPSPEEAPESTGASDVTA
jgi:polyhydroxyalkanoate synthesis regulator phasin